MRIRFLLLSPIGFASLIFLANRVGAQEPPPEHHALQPAEESSPSESGTAERVTVNVEPHDPQIERRLNEILKATGWFENGRVRADEGVVFLDGRTDEEQHRDWAGDLARRTQGVFAVVNRIEVQSRPLSDLTPALRGLEKLWTGFMRRAPLLMVGAIIAVIAYGLGRAVTWGFRRGFGRRRLVDLVQDISARALGFLVFTLGMYVAFHVSGLTRLAVTILGGTGIAGLVLGIALKDVGENVLASILLRRQQPFRKGDLVEIQGIEGFVERLTIRATVLKSLAGEQVQIPNSTVYKSSIRNFTTNPARRVAFSVGIGYRDSIARAQEIALSVVATHPAVLSAPEPWVLAEALESSAVRLRVYVWLDGTKHSWIKVQ
ncbi:MAG TPA: mechanosensitive ion channel domain-containing protein, partial [Polyangiaceae bacterium]